MSGEMDDNAFGQTDDDETDGFDLSPEFEAELLESMAEGDRGETVAAEEVLRELEKIQ